MAGRSFFASPEGPEPKFLPALRPRAFFKLGAGFEPVRKDWPCPGTPLVKEQLKKNKRHYCVLPCRFGPPQSPWWLQVPPAAPEKFSPGFAVTGEKPTPLQLRNGPKKAENDPNRREIICLRRQICVSSDDRDGALRRPPRLCGRAKLLLRPNTAPRLAPRAECRLSKTVLHRHAGSASSPILNFTFCIFNCTGPPDRHQHPRLYHKFLLCQILGNLFGGKEIVRAPKER
jgi:hypothetical protein